VCARESDTGSVSGDAVNAFAGAVSVASTPGYNGHVMGALKPGDVSLCAHARKAAIVCADIAQ
jgi:hypothetical protein